MPFCKAPLNTGVCGFGGGECEAEAVRGRQRKSLQRQVSAIVPGFPGSAIVSGQSPLQVGHGHGLFEVNHGIGV